MQSTHVVVVPDTKERLIICLEPPGVMVSVADEMHVELRRIPASASATVSEKLGNKMSLIIKHVRMSSEDLP